MINKTSGSLHSFFDLIHLIWVLNLLHAPVFVEEENCGCFGVCEAEFVLSWTSWVTYT